MPRIAATFRRLRAENRRALIPYFTAGHPSREHAVPMMHALAAAGADVIELGVPFSDPMADGPTIQKSGEHALALGVGLGDVLDWVREFRRGDDTTPVVLMGYLNPIERMGAEAFAARAAQAGVDGVLVVDLPPAAEVPGARSDLPARTDLDSVAHRAGRPRRERLCLLRVAEGRDRLRGAERR
jgi:tryptophan synthase alpha chain